MTKIHYLLLQAIWIFIHPKDASVLVDTNENFPSTNPVVVRCKCGVLPARLRDLV
jgi:hypothetical protein